MPNLAQPRPKPVVPQDLKAKATENKKGTCCPSCKKVFSRPLVMLNYNNGKRRIVNVCPYCYHVIGNAEKDKTSESNFQIADSDKKLIH
jgi:hypothetical protein